MKKIFGREFPNFIPAKKEISVIRTEGVDSDTPYEELMDDDMKKRLKRVFDSE